jgi:hypothetical protein
MGWIVLVFLLWGAPSWSATLSALETQGKEQFEKGDYGKSLQTFLKIKKEDPTNSVARDFISQCTEKIMEAEKAVRLKQAIQKGESSASTIPPKDPVPAWAVPAKKTQREQVRGAYRQKRKINRSSPLVPSVVLEKENRTSRYISQRNQLTEGYRNKILEGHAIELVRKRNRVEVVVFMNRLFLPFSDSFAPDAVPAIEAIARELRADPGKTTLFRAIDSMTPAVRHQMLDLPTRRVSILFSTLLHASVGGTVGEEHGTFTAADLDD